LSINGEESEYFVCELKREKARAFMQQMNHNKYNAAKSYKNIVAFYFAYVKYCLDYVKSFSAYPLYHENLKTTIRRYYKIVIENFHTPV
jgi:hypothetical protein